MKDQVWFTEEENFLSSIEKQCNLYNAHHTKDFMYYNKLSTRFNVPILMLSALNSLCAIALNDFVPQRFVSILNAVISAGTGVLGSIQLYMKITEKMTNSLRSQIHFKKLALKISKELSIAREQRTTEGQTFLTECFNEFNTTIEQSNPLEKKILNHLAFTVEKQEVPGTPVTDRVMDAIRMFKRAKPVASIESFENFSSASGTSDEV
jgi:hypothetical protein